MVTRHGPAHPAFGGADGALRGSAQRGGGASERSSGLVCAAYAEHAATASAATIIAQ